MRKFDFILFFSIVLTIYGLINFYIYRKGLSVLSPGGDLRWVYTVLFVLIALSFLGGRLLERVSISWASSLLVWVGSFWLGAMVYFLLALLVWDAVHLLIGLVGRSGVRLLDLISVPPWVGAVSLMAAVSVMVGWGYVNATHPRVKQLEIRLAKPLRGIPSLRVVMASDIHLGTIISHERLQRIIEIINAQDPDLILLPGDVVDEDLGPVVHHNLGELLKTLKARYGVYGATGNHEYIGGVEAACRYLDEHGIVMLRDSAIALPGGVTLVGREDRSIGQFAGKSRKSLQEILEPIQPGGPVIVMDHQPIGLQEAAQAGVDVQISGHTHNGQLWPFNYIVDAVYECGWGSYRKQETQYYVSCGVGTWGPPLRLGNSPEIVVLTLVPGPVEPTGSAR